MLNYRIDRERRMVLLTGEGALTAAGLVDLQNRLRADPDFDPAFSLLADYRTATTGDVDSTRMRQIAENAPFHPQARRAFVVQRDADYGMLRMFQSYTLMVKRSDTIRIFRDIDAALQWLESPPAAAGDR